MKTTKYIFSIALALTCALSSFAITSSYYSSIDGKSGKNLFDAIHTVSKTGYSSLSYKGLWTAYCAIDINPSGKVWDMYSNATSYTCGGSAQGVNYQKEGDSYNREHSIPKSWFGGSDSSNTPGTDLFHVVPTDGYVNNMRSAYAFGEVSAATYTSQSGCKKGSPKSITISNSILNTSGSSTQSCTATTVFEPMDEYKGDFARGYFGTMIKWANGDYQTFTTDEGAQIFNTSYDAAHYYGLKAYGVALLLKWHREDPVSAKEIARNNGIQAQQGNRNPFIDYPCLAEYLWGNKTGETVNLSELVGTFTGSWTTGDGCPCDDQPAIILPAGDVFVGSTEANIYTSKTITVQGVNLESGLTFSISGANSSFFSLSAYSMTQADATTGSTLTIGYTPTSAGDHTATLTISGGGLASSYTIELSGTCCTTYEVTLSRNGITETVGACGTYTLPTSDSESDACDGWEFAGWVTSSTPFSENQTTAPTFTTTVNSTATLYAVYSKGSGSGSSSTKTDDLTYTSIGVSGTSYSDWSGKEGSSGAVYAGQSAGGNTAIQLRTKNSNSGIITTTSGGKVTKITVEWNSNTSAGNKIDIYGKSSAYSSPTNLYDSNAGTSLGSITYGTTTELDITGDYEYIGIRSNSGAVYLDKISITWSSGGGSSTTNYKKLPCTTYTISYVDANGEAAGGTYSASATSALSGTTITLDYDEAEHYEFDSWTVTNVSTSATIAVTNGQFTMPDANVTVQANFNALCTGTLATPNVTATPGNNKITLTWEDVSGATSYTVNIGTGVGYTTECASPTIGSITHAGTTNTCVITGLVNGLEYTTSVMAYGTTVCESEPDEDTTVPGTSEVTITFNANYDGADPATATQTIPYNTATALTANSFSRTGYDFLGWATSASGEKVYNNQQSVTLTTDLDLYAVWDKKDYNVTFTPSPTGATVTVNSQSTSPQSAEFESTVTIAITADPAYELGSVTVTGDVSSSSISVSGEGNTRTFTMPAENVTVNVTMTLKTTYEIKFYNMGTQVGETQNLYVGATATPPANPTACEGYTFVGWWTVNLAEDNTTAETWVTDFTVSEPGNQNYYAVYEHTETTGGGGVSYKLVESLTNDKDYIFVTRNTAGDGYAFSSAITTGTAVTIETSGDDKIVSGTPANSIIWTVSSGLKLTTKDESKTDKVLKINGSTFALDATGSNNLAWTTSYGLNGRSSGSTKYYLQCTSGGTFSKSTTTGSSTNRVWAYEKTGDAGSSTTYYTTIPDCVECLNKVTIDKGEESNGTFLLDKDGEYENCKAGGLVVHVTDIAPAEGYQFKEITQTGIDDGVTIDNDAKTVTYDKNVAGSSTINVVFELKPTYTIGFYNGETLIGGVAQTVISGNSPSVPANPEACEGYTFVGWWTTTLATTNTTAETWVTDFTATQNQNYYAVYRHTEGGSGGGTESVTFSDRYSTNTVVEDKTISIGSHTSVTFTKGGSDTQYYTSGSAIRWYGGGTCVVSSDEGNITNITFTFGSSDGNNMIEAEGYEEPTWTGEAASVTFTQSGTSGNRRIAGISVTIGGAGGTTYYTTSFSCSGHTITVASVEHGSGASDKSRCDEGGTVTITLTADEGYDCAGITTSPSVTATKTADCTYTFTMPNEDITVTPSFTPKEPRTFTFEKGTGICETATLTEAVWNGGVTLPVATANSGCDPEYVFVGWATASITTETDERPTTLYAANTLYNGEQTTLYAVYSRTTGGSASGFTLSYTIDEVTYYAAARTGSNKYMGATTDVADAARFTIVTSGDKKYLCWHGDEDTYVSNNANKSDLLFSTNIDNAYGWEVIESGNTIALVASSGRNFMFNTNKAQRDRFAAYADEGSLTKGDAGTTVYNSTPNCVCTSVDITYNANGGTLAEGCGNVTGGECERDWKLCDAPTRDGYMFTSWKDQNGILYAAGATVPNLKISLTLTAQWAPAPYTVLFDAGSGTCVASLTEPSRGDGITLPKAEPSPACAEDWTFIGWSATRLEGETNTTATIVGVAGIPYIPATDNVTLYAVYSTLDEGDATTDYTRVTASAPEEGDYAILVAKSDASFGLLTYGTLSNGRIAYTEAYTSLPLTTISSPAATQIWHLTYDAEGYAYLYNANAGAYLAASGSNITYNANAGSAFVFTKDAGSYGDYKCLNNTASGTTNYYLGANKDANFIRYYASQTLNALNSITLYKGSIGKRYYATAPVCTPCEDPEWSFQYGTSLVKSKGSEPFTNTVIKGHLSSGTVTYSSTNEAVATVDENGLVTMHETGTTTITLRLTKAMPYCAAVLQYELTVKEPSIDIVGVTADGKIIMEHDLEGTITLDLSEGNAVSTGTAANDLFFSKYFEAASNMKLFAIFNGTGHEMDLTNIRVRCNCSTDGLTVWPDKTGKMGYVELRTISKLREQYPKLKIPSGTELIFWSNNTTTAAAGNTKLRECVSFEIGDMTYHYSDMEAMEIPNWFCLGDYTTYNTKDADGNNQFVFNGDESMILERRNPATGLWEAIDLFGAGTSEAPAGTSSLVEKITDTYDINGSLQPLNDDPGFHALCEGSTIPLSTNRYMLVRKNSVLDGMHAVASNTTSFATLCEEWEGQPVGGNKDDAAFCHSGEIFSEIAKYDYAENYIAWETITKDDYTVEPNTDGTVAVTFTGSQDMDARACTLLKVEVRDDEDVSKVLATTEYKIPIVVKAGEHMTTDDLFKNQGDKCATCDVAILGSATLTKATDGATNDMPEVRDIYVYGGGQLVIPDGTHYRAHDLILRMQMADDKVNVNVPNVKAEGSLTNQYGGAIRQQVRVGTSRFYQFAVPYPVRLEDVTFSDGQPAVYGEDFMIRYYDGETRAQNLGKASNWRNYEGTMLQPGVGYTLAVAKKAGHEQRELVFPMADASLTEGEPATKATTIHAWGDNTIRANHRGWNFLSNPYLTTYAENNIDTDAGGMLTTGRLVADPEHPGWWISDNGTVPYVTLINGTRTDYDQELVSLSELKPFTTFFIQAGDDDHNSGEEFTLTFDRAHRKSAAPASLRTRDKTSVTRFGVLLTGNNAKDNCGMVIGDNYSAAYDMQADLSKEFGSAYSLKLYTLQEDAMQMAFLATHPDSLKKPVPVGVRLPANAEYTFSIDRRYNLGAFAHIYLTDNVTGKHVDLLEDTYSFSGTRSQNDARFSLFVEMIQETPTSVDNLLNGIYVVGRKGSLMLTGLPSESDIYIYDMAGRLVMTQHTTNQTSVVCPAVAGVYQIRVVSNGAKALLRTIVY